MKKAKNFILPNFSCYIHLLLASLDLIKIHTQTFKQWKYIYYYKKDKFLLHTVCKIYSSCCILRYFWRTLYSYAHVYLYVNITHIQTHTNILHS